MELDEVEFRKLSKMPQKEASIIKEITKEKLSRYLELEEILGLSNEFEDYLKDFEIITEYKQVNEAAELLRENGVWAMALFSISLNFWKIKILRLLI